jgi:hypothetical protein
MAGFVSQRQPLAEDSSASQPFLRCRGRKFDPRSALRAEVQIAGEVDAVGLIDMSGGMGALLNAGEPFLLETDEGAIILAVESPDSRPPCKGAQAPSELPASVGLAKTA